MKGAEDCHYGKECNNQTCSRYHPGQSEIDRESITQDNIENGFTPTPCDGRNCQGDRCTHAHEGDGYPLTKQQKSDAQIYDLEEEVDNLRDYNYKLEAKCEDLEKRAGFLSGAGLSADELVEKCERDLANAKKALEEDETRREVAEVAAKLAEEEAKAAAELAAEIEEAEFLVKYDAMHARHARITVLRAKKAEASEAKEAEVVP
jgi:hypothetical protein